MDITGLVEQFFRDDRVRAVLLLILLQTGLRVAVAVRLWDVDPTQIADFIREKLVPYTIGSLTVYLVVKYMPPDVLGIPSNLVGEGLFTVVWGALVIAILGDAWKALKLLDIQWPTGQE